MNGLSRSANRFDHRLHTPDAFVRAPLPGMTGATAIVHASPAGGSGFVQYTAEFQAGGALPPCASQRFVYVLDGRIAFGSRYLDRAAFAYAAPGDTTLIRAESAARAAVIEKVYEPLAGVAAPSTFIGTEKDAAASALGDDPRLEVRTLIPDQPSFDFRVNVMTFQPGSGLPAVEVHVMEHGLLMLEGGGSYRLSDQWYDVAAGDFIWMGRFCPQWFRATGDVPAKYLIYKDWDRYPR
jgi:(S)-ureidoglycine aminohydrolase